MGEMVRINAWIRDETVKNLLNKKFVEENARLEELKEAKIAAARKAEKLAYETAFPKKIRDMLEAAPTGFYPEATYVVVRFYDPKNETNYSDENVSFGDQRRVPYKNSYQGGSSFAAVLSKDNPYSKALEEFRKLDAECQTFAQELRDRRRAITAKVLNVINSVTTVKRLLETWPEIHEFLPERVSGADGGVPAHMIADLNEEFGITPEKK